MEVDIALTAEGVVEQVASTEGANPNGGNSHARTSSMGNYQNGPAENYSDLPRHPPLVPLKRTAGFKDLG